MIRVSTNIQTVLGNLGVKLNGLSTPDQMLRTVAVSMLPVVRDRIHVQGLAADGGEIGQYSEGYMKVRTGKFESNGTYKSGPRKGQTRDSGKFTRGEHKGEPRPQYNRSADRKVVASLTRQLENDYAVVPTDTGYGIGFNNLENAEKAGHVEKTYRKPIWALTQEEKDLTLRIANDFVKEEFQ